MDRTIENKRPYKIAVVGSGNVASHLGRAFLGKADVASVEPRSLKNFPPDADIAIIAVKDSAIAEVARKLKPYRCVIAHTSGSIPMSVLEDHGHGFGVFYPLQTFTKNVELDYSEIPFFIEGDSDETTDFIYHLAQIISDKVYKADSNDRKNLHLASVFACNFTNCLMGISQDILNRSGIDFRVMLPLLRQTLAKLEHLTPAEAQTGPAVRKDYNVMENHLTMLSDNPELQDIYKNISNLIINSNERN